ncbi:SpaA isopeptide-forming pilin-related protein [Lactobacillus amylovorus]|uniref:SpaA isopeptide-forming pilin-related protein n=1 Tax=Lactobacillus amylovorus TaxID=1604 RepID=A0A9X4ABD7_LACAM|nr:SpaA isopeptide-forming pilin-related protein [Lactobacillus amylovorus]MDB6258942.1 SpaA isopeptide-forming pilin-related protein [Lactobacillus amylovorus]
MEKVFEKSTKDQLNPHKGLKFLSALGMILPVFMGSVQSVFADGHHYIQVDNIPGAVPIEQNSFGGRQGQIASVYCVHGGFWDDRHQGIHGKVDGKDMRFYCLEPEKVTLGQGSKSKYKKQQAKVGVKKVLMVGFGANSAEEMGFNGYSAEAEYATQVAVWLAQGAITSNIRWANTASGKKAHEIFDYIQKEVGKIKGNGATTLTLKATNVDKNAGTATLTPRLVENSENISREGTIRLTNMTATQDGKSVTSKIDSNKAIQVKGAGSSGSVKVTFPARTLAAPMYNAQYGNSQDTVSLVSLPAKSVSKTWSFDKPDTPPDQPQKKIKAMFDLKKKDDEGDQVDQAKFDVYTADAGYSPDEFIGTITTNKNGVARSGELDPGYYVAIERSTGKNLDIDQTPVQIDLTAENLEQNAKVTHVKNPDGSEYDLYHLDVDGPINNHKKPQI